MALVNYREVAERFSHLDGEFVGFEGKLPDGSATFAVRYYPWWEHPEVAAAVRENRRWKVNDAESGAQVVTLHARRVHEFKISQDDEVDSWTFLEDHHLLWPYEAYGGILCNSPVSLETFLDAVEAARLSTGAPAWAIWEHVDHRNLCRYGKTPPFFLGRFPRTAFLALSDQLRERGVDLPATSGPPRKPMPLLFLIDEADYIIAEDFEVDFPEFEHRPEWAGDGTEGA